jgi:amidase
MLDALSGSRGEPFAAAARREPRRLRIALSLRIPFSGAPARLAPAVRAGVERLAHVLEGLGHDVAPADPRYGLIGLTFVPRSTAGVRDWIRDVKDPSVLDPRTRHNAAMGRLLGGPVLRLARALERPLQRQVGRVFRDFDVVLAPTTAKPPPKIGAIDGLGNWGTDSTMVSHCPYAWPWNVLGWPGVNVPAGLTDDGLPIGAQLLGPADSEPELISLAAELERVERWHDRRPPTE